MCNFSVKIILYISDFRTIFNRSVPWCNYNRWHLTNYFAPFQRPQGRLNKGVNNDGQTPTIQSQRTFFNYVDQILHTIDHLPTLYSILTYSFNCYTVKSLYAVDISSTTYLPRHVNVVKECPNNWSKISVQSEVKSVVVFQEPASHNIKTFKL